MTELAVIIAALCGAGLILLAAAARFGAARRSAALVQILEQGAPGAAARADLPPEVIALARRLGAVADRGERIVRLTQHGQMWLKPGGPALPFTARQTIMVGDVGFAWSAATAMAPGVTMQVIDYLVGGRGGLEGRLFGIVPLVRFTDSAVAFRGEAMRYLAELMWNPDAILVNRQLDWRVIDARTLAVATGAGERRSEVRLLLDRDGDIARIEADDRPRAEGRDLVARPWFGRGSDFRVIDGRRIPFKAEAGWIIDGAEFVYWRGEIATWSMA